MRRVLPGFLHAPANATGAEIVTPKKRKHANDAYMFLMNKKRDLSTQQSAIHPASKQSLNNVRRNKLRNEQYTTSRQIVRLFDRFPNLLQVVPVENVSGAGAWNHENAMRSMFVLHTDTSRRHRQAIHIPSERSTKPIKASRSRSLAKRPMRTANTFANMKKLYHIVTVVAKRKHARSGAIAMLQKHAGLPYNHGAIPENVKSFATLQEGQVLEFPGTSFWHEDPTWTWSGTRDSVSFPLARIVLKIPAHYLMSTGTSATRESKSLGIYTGAHEVRLFDNQDAFGTFKLQPLQAYVEKITPGKDVLTYHVRLIE